MAVVYKSSSGYYRPGSCRFYYPPPWPWYEYPPPRTGPRSVPGTSQPGERSGPGERDCGPYGLFGTYTLPYAFLYNTSSETVGTGGYFTLPQMDASDGFDVWGPGGGVIIKHPGAYRVDVRIDAEEAPPAGSLWVAVQLDGSTAPAGSLRVPTGAQIGGFVWLKVPNDRIPGVVRIQNMGDPMTTLAGTSAPGVSVLITGYTAYPAEHGL